MSGEVFRETKHYVYVLQCADDSFYTGYAIDLERRVKEHNGEAAKAGAKYTAGRRPVRLVYQESFKTRGEAMSREAAIKQLTRKEKELLISS